MNKGQLIVFNLRQKNADRPRLPEKCLGIYLGPYFCEQCEPFGPPVGSYCPDCGKGQFGCDVKDTCPMLHSVCLEGVGQAKVFDWEIETLESKTKLEKNEKFVNDVLYIVTRVKMYGDNEVTLTRNLHTVSSKVETVRVCEKVEEAIALQLELRKKEPENTIAILLCVQRIIE